MTSFMAVAEKQKEQRLKFNGERLKMMWNECAVLMDQICVLVVSNHKTTSSAYLKFREGRGQIHRSAEFPWKS